MVGRYANTKSYQAGIDNLEGLVKGDHRHPLRVFSPVSEECRERLLMTVGQRYVVLNPCHPGNAV